MTHLLLSIYSRENTATRKSAQEYSQHDSLIFKTSINNSNTNELINEYRQFFVHYHGIMPSNKKEILTHTITWMNLESIMPREISQLQRITYFVIHFHETSPKLHEFTKVQAFKKAELLKWKIDELNQLSLGR